MYNTVCSYYNTTATLHIPADELLSDFVAVAGDLVTAVFGTVQKYTVSQKKTNDIIL